MNEPYESQACIRVNGDHRWVYAPWRRLKMCADCGLETTITDEEMATEPWRKVVDVRAGMGASR